MKNLKNLTFIQNEQNNRLKGEPAIAVRTARTSWSDSICCDILSFFWSFSVNVLPLWLEDTDQSKSDYRVVANEKLRN